MRLGHALFLASTAALLTLAAPTLARNSEPKTGEQPASSSCHAYQQAPDGSWTQLPCQETGSTAQTPHRSAAKKADEETH